MILVYKYSIILKKGFTKQGILLRNFTKIPHLLKFIKSYNTNVYQILHGNYERFNASKKATHL